MTVVAVIAKECLPGKVKTRLQPEFTPGEAAVIAAAALEETIAVVTSLPATRRILYFDGGVAPADAQGWDIIPQCGGGLDERIAALFDSVGDPLLLLGMDTPHLDPSSLGEVFAPWTDTDAWFGPATDGGFWALGMREPDGALVRGVPMSSSTTGLRQLERLVGAGMSVRLLPPLTDIDTPADLRLAAERSPRMARTLARLDRSPIVA